MWRLDEFEPQDRASAGALIQMLMSPEDEPGEESFQIVVGTPEYLASIPATRYTMTVDRWDFAHIRATLTRRVAAVEGTTWQEVARQINQWAQWEFDDYRDVPG